MRIVHLNTDRGVRPGKSKGAVVHVESMRAAFRGLGADLVALDAFDEVAVLAGLERAHQQQAIELVYERFALNSNWGVRFARRHGIPHVLEVNAPLDEEQARHRPGQSPAVDPATLADQLLGSTRLLCVSEAVARWARERAGEDVEIDVVGNGVDTELFSPLRRKAGLARGLSPEGAFVIGFHGRLRPWHAFDRLVEALSGLGEGELPYHLLMVGAGEFEAAIGTRLPRSRWTHIPWLAHEDVGEVVATFDVTALSYDPEQPCYFSPLKLLEAMAAGVVPIVPELGNLPSAVGKGAAGRIYDPHDLGTLRRTLIDLHADPAGRVELAERARGLAAGHSWESIAQRVLAKTGVTQA